MAKSKSNLVRMGVLPLAVLVLALGTIQLLRGCDQESSNTFAVRIADQWFTLETAITVADQTRGLGGRDRIADDGGMIFIFDRDEERQFWMRDCKIDIDILYLDRQGFIVQAYEMKALELQRPDESREQYYARLRRTESYPSRGRCRYVIELKAGKIRQLGLKRGQKIELDLDRLKELAQSVDDG